MKQKQKNPSLQLFSCTDLSFDTIDFLERVTIEYTPRASVFSEVEKILDDDDNNGPLNLSEPPSV
jgi:hypothetical protein